MGWVIQRTTDSKFVSKPNSKNSYTNNILKAQTYSTKEIAERNRCPENERVVNISDLFYWI